MIAAAALVILAGLTTPALAKKAVHCGNGFIEQQFAEQCDGSNLNEETCTSRGLGEGTLSCTSSCQFDTSGCAAERFVDNGLTVVDTQTGLEWEKKDSPDLAADLANLHDVDNLYTWNQAIVDWISDVNGRSADGQTHINPFAGHTDWRLPQIEELRGILSAQAPNCTSSPCIDPVFGPTAPGFYWSARAVRGGSN